MVNRKPDDNALIIFYDVSDLIDEVKREPWTYFQAEPFVSEIQGKRFFEIEIKADRGECSLSGTGFEGEPVTINVDYGSGSEQRSRITLKGLSKIGERAESYAKVLQELSKVCDFIKRLAEEGQRPEAIVWLERLQ